MKKIISLTLSVISLAASAQVAPDTVVDVTAARRLVITEGPSGLSASVETPDSTIVYSRDFLSGYNVNRHQSFSSIPVSTGASDYRWKRPNSGIDWDIYLGGLSFGFIGGVDALEPSKSLEVGIERLLAIRFWLPRGYFQTGLGLNWRVFAMTRDNAFMPDSDGSLAIVPWDPARGSLRKSRLNTFSLQFPVTYTLELPVDLGGFLGSITAGCILNWNTYASTTTRWGSPGVNEERSFCRDLHQRRFTVDLTASVQLFRGVKLYVRYSPMAPFAPSMGPQFHPFSVGLSLW